jgi:hypothetical protein
LSREHTRPKSQPIQLAKVSRPFLREHRTWATLLTASKTSSSRQISGLSTNVVPYPRQPIMPPVVGREQGEPMRYDPGNGIGLMLIAVAAFLLCLVRVSGGGANSI